MLTVCVAHPEENVINLSGDDSRIFRLKVNTMHVGALASENQLSSNHDIDLVGQRGYDHPWWRTSTTGAIAVTRIIEITNIISYVFIPHLEQVQGLYLK